MSLTPEQWRELDEAEKAWVAAHTAACRSTGTYEAYVHARRAVENAVFPVLRALVDAARPKCKSCAGFGCKSCNGTGWAT